MSKATAEQNTPPTWRLKGKPVKFGKATLQRRADPVTIRDYVSGKQKPVSGSRPGGIVLDGQHTFLEAMPRPSWFKIRTTPKGKRQVYLIFRCTGLLPIEYGPFPNEARALWMLDRMFNGKLDYLSSPNQFDRGSWSQEEARNGKFATCLSLVD